MTCGNEECATCSTDKYYVVEEEFVQCIVYQRTIRAASSEAALARFKQGTAWPASYDYRFGEILEQQPIRVTEEDAERTQSRSVSGNTECWDSAEHKAAVAAAIEASATEDDPGIFSDSSSDPST